MKALLMCFALGAEWRRTSNFSDDPESAMILVERGKPDEDFHGLLYGNNKKPSKEIPKGLIIADPSHALEIPQKFTLSFVYRS